MCCENVVVVLTRSGWKFYTGWPDKLHFFWIAIVKPIVHSWLCQYYFWAVHYGRNQYQKEICSKKIIILEEYALEEEKVKIWNAEFWWNFQSKNFENSNSWKFYKSKWLKLVYLGTCYIFHASEANFLAEITSISYKNWWKWVKMSENLNFLKFKFSVECCIYFGFFCSNQHSPNVYWL